MSVREYYMWFIKLAKYSPHMVPNEKAKIRRFVYGLGDQIQDTTTAAAVSVGSIGGGNQGVPSKGSLVPAQSMPRTSCSFPGSHSQGNAIQSRKNQNFRTPVSQSQSSVRQPSY
ncbi:hypothetical protein HAX54_051438 [Datura stramonium]|uniref:Retrotransposon gag domain-containing protein n=1 Tax=Datura stramonium TaxID=4076 RepID=A0ABS8WPM6_DATST|nr:hypothetical protein [Datura stramonium]